MIKLFDLQDGKLSPSIHCHSILWLKDIMTYFPDIYMKIYTYIFYMTCPDQDINPYVNVAEVDKSDEVLRAIIAPGDPTPFWIEDDKVDRAVRESRNLYAHPAYEAYMAAKMMLEKLKRSFQIEELTWGGKDATGPALIAAMEKLPKLIQAYAETELKLNQELKSRARGNQHIADDINELDDD